jgi:hypothetical protein
VAAPHAARDALELIPGLLPVVVSSAMARRLERDVQSADGVSVIGRALAA